VQHAAWWFVPPSGGSRRSATRKLGRYLPWSFDGKSPNTELDGALSRLGLLKTASALQILFPKRIPDAESAIEAALQTGRQKIDGER